MQERALQTRDALLAAARDEFSEKGFYGARVDVIAARAAVNKQRIYACFGSKAGLFSEILKGCFSDMAAEERQLLKLTAADIPRLPELILARYVRIHENNPRLWRILAWENLAGGGHAEVLAGVKEPVFQHLRALYHAGQKRGCFRRRVPFEAFIFSLLGLSYFMFSNRHTLKRTLGLDTGRASVRRTLCENLIQQYRENTP